MKYKSNEQNIWFVSDSHYGHKNIVRGVSDWENKNGCRDFDMIEEMNNTLVEGINKYVQQDDILIHLGDWSFGGLNNIWKFRQRLNVKVIHLILGNHDTHIKQDKLFPGVHSLQFPFIPEFEDNGELIEMRVTTKDMFTTIHTQSELLIDKKLIILSHYPICSWNKAYRGAWMLHGHTHNTLFKSESDTHWYKNSKILDVGMDSAYALYGEYRPFSFEDIKSIMDKRNFISIDQHDKKTNG